MEGGYLLAIKKDTKTILCEALLLLAKNKPLESITILEILQQSGISRATFYRHFRDKFDLMSYSYTNFSNDLLYKMLDNRTRPLHDIQAEISLKAAYNYYNNKEYYANIVKYTGQNSFTEASIKNGIDYFIYMFKSQGLFQISNDLLFAIKYHASAATYMLIDWMDNGFNISPEEHCRLLQNSMPSIIKETFNYIDKCTQQKSNA